ncbi:MAG TPA: ABC transporter permease [Lutibacter sp.]|nr:ABC transporter permease [Lutibacter sp.]
MNYELFIAKRLITSKKYKSSISAPIMKIGMIAIALGIIVMLISIATGIGLQEKIREKVSGFNGHIQVINYDFNNSMGSVKPISTKQSFYPSFKTLKGIHKVQVYAQKTGIIKTKTDFEGIVLKGVGSDYDWRFFKEYLVEGKLPSYGEKRSDKIIISQIIANRLQLSVSDSIAIWFVRKDPNKLPQVRKLIIEGIYNSGFPEFDESFVIGDIKHIQRLNKWKKNEVGGFEILLEDFDDLEEKTQQIRDEIPAILNAISIKSKFPVIFEWISLFDSNIIVIIIIMILVAGFNMITALLVLILERTQMIGVLKALGDTNWHIRKIFLYQATYLIVKGLFWGNLIGISLLLIQKYFGIISLDPENYHVDQAPVYLNIVHILLLNLGVIVLSYTMLLIPSYFITKISPVRAIRFE